MDYFGLNSPEDLPKLKEVYDDTLVNPTFIEETPTVQPANLEELAEEEVSILVVSETGELLEGPSGDNAQEPSVDEENNPEGPQE